MTSLTELCVWERGAKEGRRLDETRGNRVASGAAESEKGEREKQTRTVFCSDRNARAAGLWEVVVVEGGGVGVAGDGGLVAHAVNLVGGNAGADDLAALVEHLPAELGG